MYTGTFKTQSIDSRIPSSFPIYFRLIRIRDPKPHRHGAETGGGTKKPLGQNNRVAR